MKNIAGLLVLFFFLFFGRVALAVPEIPDTSVLLDDVTVTTPRAGHYLYNHRVIRLDSARVLSAGDESLGELLQRQLPVVLMQYGGAGALSSLSLRGMPSSQTLVNWNGFPLNARTSGMADLSQINGSLFEQVSLVPGAAGSLYGSGTAGGALNLDNRPGHVRGLILTAGAAGGSFASWNGHLALQTGTEKTENHTRLFWQHARNDFPYRDDQLAGTPVVRASHNAFGYGGLLHNTYVRLRRNWLWEGGVWLQRKKKEIPSPMGSYAPGTQTQRDSSLRLYTALGKHWQHSLLSVRAAWFFDNMRFTDKSSPDAPGYSLDSRFRTSRLMSDLFYSYATRKHLLLDGGVAFSHTSARVTNYRETIGEEGLDLYGGLRYVRQRWRLHGTVRQVFHTGAAPRPQGEAGFRYQAVASLLTLHGTLATHYRLPTLNDRYWVPGGNDSLQAERGWSAGGGLTLTLPRRQTLPWQITWQSDAYYNIITDQIRWIPSGAFWQPENVEEVHARGMENSLNISWHQGRLRLSCLLNHYLTFSTVTDAAGREYDSRYIPRHTTSATLRGDYGIFFAGIYLNHASRRYTTTDNDPLFALDPYLLTGVVTGIKTGKGKVQYHLQLVAGNLFNVQYQVIRSYAMPGRTLSLKAQIIFRTKQSLTHKNSKP